MSTTVAVSGEVSTVAKPTPAVNAHLHYVLRLADTNLILAQRLGEWIGHAPVLEDDLGLANIALDHIGQARLFLAYAGELEGCGRDEDALAFQRAEAEFFNVTLVEQPNGDFGQTIVRQLLVDAWQIELYAGLMGSRDPRIAEIAAKAVKETRYHLGYSSGWVIRLGDGTGESHARVQQALERFWPYTIELTVPDEVDREMIAAGIAPPSEPLRAAWSARVDGILTEARLERPAPASFRWFGKQGRHSEHLGYILADLQFMQRAYPGATW
ncbi:MAG TPA: 1,2-phenylacetyl-CoA epoxidase subunit PaaC [Steroidobacteraceae bacterium]